MITFAIDGEHYTGFTAASVTVSMSTLANDFTFTVPGGAGPPPWKQGSTVEAYIDDEKVLTGFIEEVAGVEGEGAHTLTYSGRDKTGDFIDSDIDVLNDLRASASLTLKKIVEAIVGHIGADIEVVDGLDPAPFNESEDLITAQPGQKAYDLAAAYARKRQAILTSDADGRIVITEGTAVESGAAVQRVAGASDNNIVQQQWAVNSTKRFNKYIRRGQLNPLALNSAGESDSAAVEDQNGEATDENVRAGRQNVEVQSNVQSPFGPVPYSAEQLQNLATWGKQLAKADSIGFTCTVKGHTSSAGDIYATNELIQVYSDAADISRKMLLDTATFSQAEGSLTATVLKLVDPSAYTINERILNQKQRGSLSDDFSALG